MCTLVTLIRPDHDWPLILAANRDEMRDRPWQAPARHWEDRSFVTAGRDELAGGTWLGINDDGVVAGVLNRINTLGPSTDKRSRGELPLEALDPEDARTAAQAIANIDPDAYRPFNMIIADMDETWCLVNDGQSDTISMTRVKPGVSMITALDLNDPTSPRISYHRPRFQAAPPPEPSGNDWFAWQALLADRSREPRADEPGAMFLGDGEPGGFGTVSSSLIALPARKQSGERVRPK